MEMLLLQVAALKIASKVFSIIRPETWQRQNLGLVRQDKLFESESVPENLCSYS
jgi:ABC-type bacteriocin/lantibiotic exporter with double-glycine peptidase domain